MLNKEPKTQFLLRKLVCPILYCSIKEVHLTNINTSVHHGSEFLNLLLIFPQHCVLGILIDLWLVLDIFGTVCISTEGFGFGFGDRDCMTT